MKFLVDNSIPGIFGTVTPPSPIAGYTGAMGISKFLSNAVILIYSLAAVVLVFMILWGAFEWIISEGDKEKISAAQKKIINAIIGIALFAAAFAIISVLGIFTGFKFFKGQNGSTPTPRVYLCSNGTTVSDPADCLYGTP